MKKVFLSAALALAVAGSWAFYPTTDGPSGYMMVVGSGRTSSFASSMGSLTVIQPNGSRVSAPNFAVLRRF